MKHWVLCHDTGELFCNWHPEMNDEFNAYALYIAYGPTPPAIAKLGIIITGGTQVENLCWKPMTTHKLEELTP